MEIEDLIQKIILKAYEISKNTKHDVVVDFCGYSNDIIIYVYKNGMKKNKRADYRAYIMLDEKIFNKVAIKEELQKTIEFLEKLEGSEQNND